MADFEIPKRASLDDIKDIIKAYYIEGAHNEGVKTDAVEATSGLGDKVGRQTNFLDQIGVLKKDGWERLLTDDGEQIAEALMGGNESLAQSLLREALLEWEMTSKITGFVRMQDPDPVGQERLVEYISANAASSDDRGQETLLDLYVWAKILERGENGYTISDRSTEEEEEQEKPEEDQPTGIPQEDAVEESVEKMPVSGAGTAQFQINIEISASDDPDDVEEVILRARKALQKEVDNDEGL